MWGAIRQGFARCAIGGLLIAGSAFASESEVRTARVAVERDVTRVTFDFSGAPDYKLFDIANPERIVLDVHDGTFAEGFAAPVGKGVLKSIRTGVQNKTDARIVFDLAASVRAKSFLDDSAGGFKLVVELTPKAKGKTEVAKTLRMQPAAKARDVVIMIDPGHGGDDPGAIGNGGTHEANITLAVSRELKRQIDKMPGMHAVLTREGDYYVALEDRYHRAREVKADLFVSVHADAFSSADARGSSVWMLSPRGATSEAARFLADRENNSDVVGGVKLDKRKDNTLAAVLLDLSQGATLEASGVVAQQVLRALAKLGPTHRGYVEKANFVVLRSPDVPSILVETAFITNPVEEKRLNSTEQRELLATAILSGVRNYFELAPPPGTVFAANAERGKGERLAARKLTASEGEEVNDESVAARVPRS
jgi:N-acetylmuramoyl-L-alanine amidase